MKLKIVFRGQGKELEKEFHGNCVKELLTELRINPLTVLIKKGNELVLEEEKLNEGDLIELIPVKRGG